MITAILKAIDTYGYTNIFQKNRWYMLPWLIANWIGICAKILNAFLTLYTIFYVFRDIFQVTLLAVLVLDICKLHKQNLFTYIFYQLYYSIQWPFYLFN